MATTGCSSHRYVVCGIRDEQRRGEHRITHSTASDPIGLVTMRYPEQDPGRGGCQLIWKIQVFALATLAVIFTGDVQGVHCAHCFFRTIIAVPILRRRKAFSQVRHGVHWAAADHVAAQVPKVDVPIVSGRYHQTILCLSAPPNFGRYPRSQFPSLAQAEAGEAHRRHCRSVPSLVVPQTSDLHQTSALGTEHDARSISYPCAEQTSGRTP